MSRASMWRSITAGRKDITIGCRRWQPSSFADKWPGSSRAARLRQLLPRRRPRQFQFVINVGIYPVQLGLVASLNRPGGTVPGLSLLTVELTATRLQLL